MFRIKICGVTDPTGAQCVADAGADAVGLNFYPSSRRYVSLDAAERIVERLPANIQRVGLFVNATDDEVCRVFDHLQLDLIQLHGDETPEFLMSLAGRPVMRAFRMGPSGIEPIVEYLAACRAPGVDLRAVLIDAYRPDQYGGTGEVADWDRLRAGRDRFGNLRLVLAGGLNQDNVAEAIRMVRPDAVDTASGVETAPGVKDAAMTRQFVLAATRAFEAA